MKLGIDGRKIPGAVPGDPVSVLRTAHELGMEGVFFRTVLDMSPTLDACLLAETRAVADDLGMYLESGLGKVNPYASPETPELRRIGDGDVVLGFRRMMQACAEIDCRELWIGTANYQSAFRGRFAYDRFRTDVSWAEQLRAIRSFLQLLAPIARDLGIHLNLETHEEITSFEVVRLVEQTGPDVAGIVFDTANVLQRLEDPVAAAHRVAPHVRQTHLKDAVLVGAPGGLRYQMRPSGTGVVDFAAILPVLAAARPDLNLSMETDQPRSGAPLDMLVESADPAFVAAHPDVTEAERRAHAALVRDAEARIRAGLIPSVDAYAAAPFGVPEARSYIHRSAAHLRSLLPAGVR
ncbi:sugar phosphate isomerase/epimerase [Pseudonocardia sp. WMMC193]|uniref:sugar phosphate isomerase/epimerase family protein n=1 Tax=Pseudonocardia sp. WMMC193 TaxID=2911965 RepID=UPI001F456B64|nr:sugar phosphate isomerase/epimerase family protein [Pseudonocardia sp. WMMC193]MCF7552734.1 sugar phosphate isomerase/epimerase [Pseudonocardia sp. WMMC193]